MQCSVSRRLPHEITLNVNSERAPNAKTRNFAGTPATRRTAASGGARLDQQPLREARVRPGETAPEVHEQREEQHAHDPEEQ